MGRRLRRFFGFAAGTAAVWAFAVKPRVWDKPDISDIRRYDYARRGLFRPEDRIPENSREAIREAIRCGYGLVLPIRVTWDGVPVLFHDDRLYRMTNVDGSVEESSWEELQALCLSGTEEKILSLEEALALIDGQVPVLIELPVHHRDVASFCAAVCSVLDGYGGVFAVQSMDPRVLRWYRKERNEYIRGQMIDYHYSSGSTLRNWIWDLFCNSLLMNFLTEPDLLICSPSTRWNPSVWLCRFLYRIPRLNGTLSSLEAYEETKMEGSIAVFEGIAP